MRFALVMAATAACSGGGTLATDGSGTTPTGETGATSSGPATLLLTFDLDPDLIPYMDGPASGKFLGSVYAEADASAIGPNDGAVSLVDFESDPIDFGTTGGPVASMATVGPLDPQVVWILGCFDNDANDCECHDPVTIPNENKVQVTSGSGTYTVQLSLLDPC